MNVLAHLAHGPMNKEQGVTANESRHKCTCRDVCVCVRTYVCVGACRYAQMLIDHVTKGRNMDKKQHAPWPSYYLYTFYSISNSCLHLFADV